MTMTAQQLNGYTGYITIYAPWQGSGGYSRFFTFIDYSQYRKISSKELRNDLWFIFTGVSYENEGRNALEFKAPNRFIRSTGVDDVLVKETNKNAISKIVDITPYSVTFKMSGQDVLMAYNADNSQDYFGLIYTIWKYSES